MKSTEISYSPGKIVPFLWFNSNAEEAVNFYISTFTNSGIISTSRYGNGAPMPPGTLMTASFYLEGQEFIALNGGPVYVFSPAVSLYVKCHTQEEIDRLWNRLSEGGEEQMCGWVKDKFGLSWQIVPPLLGTLLSDKDGAKSGRVMKAMLSMKKIIIADLLKAYEDEQI